MNRHARRAVYQDVTGWGGRRRAVRAGSRMGIGRHAASGKFQRTMEGTGHEPSGKGPAAPPKLTSATPAGVITVNDGANILELFRS